MRFAVLIILAALIASCNTYRVEPVDTAFRPEKEGVFYYLPKTQIQIDVVVRETRFLKGPFAQYSAKFTGISNVISENTKEFAIQQITATTLALPDTNKLFYVITGKLKKKEPFLLNLSDNGCIVSLNTPVIREPLVSGVNQTEADHESNNYSSEGFSYFATENTRVKTDTILEKIILDTITIEKQILQHSIIEKTMEDKAKDAADYIKLISENRMNLIAGYPEVDFNHETFTRMLAELDEMLKEYQALFTGKTVSYTYHYRFNIDPAAGDCGKPRFLFSFFKKDGIGSEEDSLFVDNMFYVRYSTAGQSEGIVSALESQRRKPNKGLAYNIPEETMVVVEKGNGEKVFTISLPVCQMGCVSYLPAHIRKVIFNPSTGSVLELEQ